MNNMSKSVRRPACITLIICILFILCSVTWADSILTIPVSVEIVEEEAFAGSGVTVAVVTSGVKAIGNRAFADCSKLTDVVLPNHDIAIADDAFSGCGDVLFHTFSGSKNELWALGHGFRCESENPDILNQTSAMLTRFGIPSSSLQSDNRKYATCRLIVKMAGNRLPDISAYEPTEIIQAGRNRYFIQFDGPENTRLCCESLEADQSANGVLWVEPDAYFDAMEPVVSQQNVAAGWADNDPMNFDVYSAFVAEEGTGAVKIAVLDSGFPSNSVYDSKLLTSKAKSFTLDGKDWRVDGFGHGRTVAAVIAKCTGNAGVKILPVKVADSAGRVDTISMLLGLEYAAQQGVSFINLSIDYDDPNFRSEAIEDAICYCGATVVAAAGNFGSNRSCNSYFPARLNSVISVGAVNPDYALSSYSCKDADYAAPGSVTVSGYSDTGTSFSAPQITAALALLRLDPYHGQEEFDACCKAVNNTGKGMPQLEKLAQKSVVSVRFENLPDQMLFDDFLVLEWSVLPRDATDTTVTCVSSDSSVIEVKANTSGMIQIIARGCGEAKLTIRSDSNPDVYDERQIRVIKRATKLTLQGPADGVVYMNQQVTLTPVFTPSDTSIRELVWESSKPSILSVENGVVTPHKTGKATVTAKTTDGSGLKATISLTVQQRPPVEKITVMAEDAPDTACTGETLQLTALVEPELALQEVTWESLFPDVASIDEETGLVSFITEGTAVFIAESKDGTNVKGSFQIPVRTTVQIVFDPNGGACSVGSMTAYSGQAVGELPTPTRGGYTFDDWYTSANGGTQVTASTVFTGSGTVTVYAHWTANLYTVTFNGNGGTASPAKKTVTFDSTYGDLATTTRTGYTFAGWFTAASGGKQVKSSTKVTTASNHTLYAHWTENPSYTVTFNANGGSVSPTTTTVTYDTTYGVLATPTRTGYTFDGWFTAASGGSQVTSSTKVTTASDHTLYAHWTANLYTVTFDSNGGTASSTSKTVTYDSTYGDLTNPTRTGYGFVGWFTAASGGNQVTSSTKVTTASNHTLYAHWTTPYNYTVTFNGNGGTAGSASKTVTYDSTYGDLPTATRTGYTFAGWFTAASGGSQVTSSTKVTTASNYTLYAHWTANPYTVTFNGNGGTAGSASKTVTFDSTYGDLPTATRTGYTFAGWFTAASGGSQVTSSTKVTTASNHTLYAHWTANSYTVTFNGNSGTASSTSKTVTYGSTYGDLATATRTGYTFAGWYTAASGGSQVTSSTTVATAANHTLYAHWTGPNEYTYSIVYKSSNGTALGNSSIKKVFGTTNTVTPPDYAGYTTPSAQSVVWDATSKTITFTYAPAPGTATSISNVHFASYSSGEETYSAEITVGERTATSVQIKIKVTFRLPAGAYNSYAHKLTGQCGDTSIPKTTIVSLNKWKSSSSSVRTESSTTSWITVPVSATQSTVNANLILRLYNSSDTYMSNLAHTEKNVAVNIPAY